MSEAGMDGGANGTQVTVRFRYTVYIYIYCASCCETNRVICMVKIGETLLQLTRGTEYFNHF